MSTNSNERDPRNPYGFGDQNPYPTGQSFSDRINQQRQNGQSGFNPPQQYKQHDARPSNNPAHPQLAQKNNPVNLPDLLSFIRIWHKGKRVSGTTIPWFIIEVIHLDTSTVIYVHECEAGQSDEDVLQILESRVEQRARGYNPDGGLSRFEIRCHFRSEDGEVTAWEPYTVPINLPPQTPQWGQPHYGGFGGSNFGGGPSNQNQFGNVNNTLAVSLRHNIDSAQRSDAVLMRAIDLIEGHSRRLEASNARHEDRELQRMQLMDELQNTSAKRKLDEQMAEMKMAALQTALEKFMQTLPLGIGVIHKWVKNKYESRNGKITSKEEKSIKVLTALYENLSKGPAGKDPNIIRQMLLGAGVQEETVNGAFDLFQEIAFEKMIETSEKRTKESILGMGEGDENGSGLKRLLAAAGIEEKNEDDKNKVHKGTVD